MINNRCTVALLTLLFLSLCGPVFANKDVSAIIAYVERQHAPRPILSNLLVPPDDAGLMGTRLAIEDNQTTGRFLGHKYELAEIIIAPESPWPEAVFTRLPDEVSAIVVNASMEDLLALADHKAMQSQLIFNVAAKNDSLRETACRPNVLHTMPSYAMLADALMQFLAKRRWTDLMLVEGNKFEDQEFSQAIERASKRFGGHIKKKRTWEYDADIRRSAGQEVPRFTQGVDFDTLIVSDTWNDFGQYFLYNTWIPRPVSGSHGLRPTAFSRANEQWGAVQLHSRFEKLAGREVTEKDYAAWAAVRAIGEAITRTADKRSNAIRQYLLSDGFEMAGFKGRPLSFRKWNGQMRQPISLVHAQATVDTAPIEGFLHPHTELDTLGYDAPETKCNFK